MRSIVFKAFVTNLGRYNEGELVGQWLNFPIEHDPEIDVREAINEFLCDEVRIDGVRYEEYFITDYDSDVAGLTDCFGEYEDLLMLNFLAHKIKDMDISREQLEAMIEYGEFTRSVEELINLTDNGECFYFLPDVKTDYDLGYEYAENSGQFTEALQSLGMLASYIDYEAYGRDIRLEECGLHTDNGYIVLTDDITTYFDSATDEIPDFD